MGMARVRVRRERPTAVALAVALCVTMLVVYLLTLGGRGPDAVQSVAAAPRVTRQVAFEALEGWCVCMARCDSPQEARLRASAWVSRGSAGYVAELDGAWLVLGAVYDGRREAERVAKRLADEAGIPAQTLRLEAARLTLRVTAPEAQIEAIAGADALLGSQGGRLGELALQLDRGEIGPDAARALCAVAATEASAAEGALAGIPGAADNALCAALIGRLDTLAQLQQVAAEGEGLPAATLSGMLRCAQVDAFLGRRALRRDMAGR